MTGVFPDDPDDKKYHARTDAKIDVIGRVSWFYIPYPGKIFYISHFKYKPRNLIGQKELDILT